MTAPKKVTVKLNGRPVILTRGTRAARFREGLVKEFGRGYALIVTWAWVFLPQSEWDTYPDPITLAEHVPADGDEALEFLKAVSSLFEDGAKEPEGKADGGASSPSPASPSESEAQSGSV